LSPSNSLTSTGHQHRSAEAEVQFTVFECQPFDVDAVLFARHRSERFQNWIGVEDFPQSDRLDFAGRAVWAEWEAEDATPCRDQMHT